MDINDSPVFETLIFVSFNFAFAIYATAFVYDILILFIILRLRRYTQVNDEQMDKIHLLLFPFAANARIYSEINTITHDKVDIRYETSVFLYIPCVARL